MNLIIPLYLILSRSQTGGSAIAHDLLESVVQYLRAAPTVTAVVPAIYEEVAPAGVNPPWVVVRGYEEQKPGQTADDSPIPLTIVIRTADGLDTARSFGAIVKAAIDSPAINTASLARSPFVWTTGTERACLRKNSRPHRMPGIARGGTYAYEEVIAYTFHANPSQ